MLRAFIAVAAAALVGACAQVESNVSAYCSIDSGYQGKTIVIVPLDDTQANNMEFRDYTRRVEGHFAQKGLRPASLDQAKQTLPDYVAFFDFGIDDGQRVASTYSIPTYGVTGYRSLYSTGTLSMYGNTGYYSGTRPTSRPTASPATRPAQASTPSTRVRSRSTSTSR